MMTVEEARCMLQTDKLAQDLLGSPIVARLAYTWRDGSGNFLPLYCPPLGLGSIHRPGGDFRLKRKRM